LQTNFVNKVKWFELVKLTQSVSAKARRYPIPVTELARTRSYSPTAIARELRQAIDGGSFTPGEKLPTERQLADHFGASRATVREALREVEAGGLILRRVGSGTFVKDLPGRQKDIADITSPLELLDVRLAVEPNITRRAVANSNTPDIERLREALKQVEASGDDIEHFTYWDQQFHLRLAECSRNPLMVWLYTHLNEVRSRAQWAAVKGRVLTPRRMNEYNSQHRAVFTALERRDAAAAGRLMTAHLEKARSDMMGQDAGA